MFQISSFLKRRALPIGLGIGVVVCVADFTVMIIPKIFKDKNAKNNPVIINSLNTIAGTSDNDTLSGTAKNDKLDGYGGNDELLGLAGNDILDGGLGNDKLNGGEGIDTVNYEFSSTPVNIDLSTGTVEDESASIDTLVEIEGAIGSKYGDRILGNDDPNSLSGGEGEDILIGKAGNDLILGGRDRDILRGDSGKDSFIYINPTEGADTIEDFEVGIDSLKLAAFNFSRQLPKEMLPENFFVRGTKATNPEQYFIYDRNTGRLYFDYDGNGKVEPRLLVIFENLPDLSAKDISLL